MVVGRAELGDLFHHLLLLVDLDGKDAPVAARVTEVFNGLAERFMDIADARIQDVFHPQKYGHIVAAVAQPGDDFRNGHLRPLGALRADDHLARVRNVKIPCSPVADAVKLYGVFHPPLLQRAVLCQCLLLAARMRRADL